MAFRHLLVFLPGIMGSALERRVGAKLEPVWTLSGVPLWQVLKVARTSLGGQLNGLAMGQEDITKDDLGDGIVPTKILPDLHSIPKLTEAAGYGPFCQKLVAELGLKQGDIHAPVDDANFFPYPYDWRRDNRVSARKLGRFIENQLPKWRAKSGAKDAQVIIIGHSMGGLVSRYYVEVLGGWKTTRALITIGTPHRGSINALDNLCNGMKIAFADLSEVVRTLPSVYQLLPTYPCVQVGTAYHRVAELDGIPNIQKARAVAARNEFHEVILSSAAQNRADPAYRTATLPWVGADQDTYQSAVFNPGKVTPVFQRIPQLSEELGDGDGTVPLISAIPADLSGKNLERFAIERHGWLTNSVTAVAPVITTVRTYGASSDDLGALHGGAKSTAKPSIKLRLEPVFEPGEQIGLQLSLKGAKSKAYSLNLRIRPSGKPALPIRKLSVTGDQPLVVDLGALEANMYQIEIAPANASSANPDRINGVFEVVS
jgi:pimeloyl-ACP methyl ester carboxylesterase